MRLSSRERTLAVVTGLTVFLCLNWFGAGQLLEKWRETSERIVQTRRRIGLSQSVLALEPQWQAQHRELLARLRQSASGESTGDIIPRIEAVSSQLDVTFSSRSPSAPVDRDRYIERAANFNYQGQWSNMIKFLFALTKQPGVYRVTALRMRADAKDPNQLAGDMKIVTYYLPSEPDAAPPTKQTSADSTSPTAQEKR